MRNQIAADDLDTGHFLFIVDFQVVVDKFDVLARGQRPVVLLDLCDAHTAVEFRHLIAAAVRALALPGVVDVGGSCNLGAVQQDFLFILALYRVFRPGTQVHKEDFVFVMAEISAVVAAAFFILVQDPKGHTDVRGDEQFSRQDDDGFYLVILDQLFADLQCVAVIQCAVGKQETCHTGLLFEVRKDM